MDTMIDTHLDQFRMMLVDRGRSDKTAKIYHDQMRRMHAWRSTPAYNRGAAADDIARWINQGRADGDSAATTRQKLAAARAYLQWTGEDLGPLGDYKAPPLPAPAPHPLPGGMTDIARMIEKADSPPSTRPWLRYAIALGGYAGLRVSESISIPWSQVDFNRGELIIRGKGDKTRVVPMSDKLRAILHAAPERHNGSSMVCWGVSDSVARKAISQVAYDVGLNDVSSHDLRATFATSLYKKTGDVVMVSKLLGHASIATTQAYLGFDQEIAAAAVNAL